MSKKCPLNIKTYYHYEISGAYSSKSLSSTESKFEPCLEKECGIFNETTHSCGLSGIMKKENNSLELGEASKFCKEFLTKANSTGRFTSEK